MNRFAFGFSVGLTTALLAVGSMLLFGFRLERTPTMFRDMGCSVAYARMDDIVESIEMMKRTGYHAPREIVPLVDAYLRGPPRQPKTFPADEWKAEIEAAIRERWGSAETNKPNAGLHRTSEAQHNEKG